MNKAESKYFNTARLMDEALLLLLESKDIEFITVKERDVHIPALTELNYSHLETYIMEHLLLTYLIKHIRLT